MKSKQIPWIIITLFVVGLFVLLYFVSPITNPVYPCCPFKLLTGLQCPACGLLRGIHALSHGHVAEAFRLNALFVISIPVAIIAMLIQFEVLHQESVITKNFHRFITIKNVCIAVGLWWIVRNVFGW
ncbi:MAG: DUF2752 domain-containing protein [Flavobacteriales bacterium]